MSSAPVGRRAVVLVDDEAILTLSLRMELQSYLPVGTLIRTASGGAEALEVLDELAESSVAVRVVISDWRMPEMSGTELLRLVHARLPEAGLILLSGKMESDDTPDVPHQFFGKPWKRESLREAVLTALGD